MTASLTAPSILRWQVRKSLRLGSIVTMTPQRERGRVSLGRLEDSAKFTVNVQSGLVRFPSAIMSELAPECTQVELQHIDIIGSCFCVCLKNSDGHAPLTNTNLMRGNTIMTS